MKKFEKNGERPKGKTFKFLQATLKEGLENSKKSNIGGSSEKEFNKAYPKILKDIENLKYIGQVGRYAMYQGPYKILVNMDTNKIYFLYSGDGNCGIYKAEMNEPQLFWRGYYAG